MPERKLKQYNIRLYTDQAHYLSVLGRRDGLTKMVREAIDNYFLKRKLDPTYKKLVRTIYEDYDKPQDAHELSLYALRNGLAVSEFQAQAFIDEEAERNEDESKLS